MTQAKEISYGTHARQQYDLFIPRQKKNAGHLFVLLHGGAWVTGSKKMLHSLALFLVEHGFFVVNMNYRLLQQVKTIDEQVEDIHTAFKHVKNNFLKDYSISKTIVLGESAGGHLSFLSYQKAQWDAIISLSGPLNYTQNQERKLPFNAQKWFIPYLLKNKPKDMNNWKSISPLYQEVNCSVLIFQGKKDKLVYYQDAVEFMNALKVKDAQSRLVLIPNWGHLYRINKRSRKFVYKTIVQWTKDLGI